MGKIKGLRHAKGSAGSVYVEFAVILPLLITLLFAIIEFGFLFKDQLLIQQAAREGARVAAVGKTVSEILAQVTGSATDLTLAGLTTTIQFRTYAGGWSGWTTLSDNGVENNAPQGAQIRVQCTYNHRLLTGPMFARIIGHPGDTQIALYARMVMRRE